MPIPTGRREMPGGRPFEQSTLDGPSQDEPDRPRRDVADDEAAVGSRQRCERASGRVDRNSAKTLRTRRSFDMRTRGADFLGVLVNTIAPRGWCDP
jgi:hypothetical protein